MPPNDTQAPTLLTRREAAAILRISERMLFTLTKRGDVPCVRIGRSVKYRPSDIAAFVEQNLRSCAAPTQPMAAA